MKYKWLPLVAAFSLAGCSTPQVVSSDVEPSQQVSTAVEQLSWTKLALPVDVTTELSKNSQILLLDGVASPVATFSVDGNRGSLDVEVASLVVKESSMYAPSVKITDDKDRVLAEKSFSDFEYKEAKLLNPDRYVANLTVIPFDDSEELHILVYSTKEDIAGGSTVTHPAKLYAKARSNQPPEIADPVIPHSLYGTLTVKVDANNVVTKREQTETEYVPAAATSEEYYKSAIEKAVAEDNIPKALSLLDEAKALNIEGVQEVFVKAINAK
ncbi:transcriptional regulator [Vibrio sp. SCSIO 43140]|uniref:MalM family protein n=1 Tax=Vibrio sp. SCSIO 43140 TaxID=2819100 RepID=UPI00207558C1|nr:MalM family protein [Vibrio sp. SCSIO 43140]USD62888.1 transcriptional regulator [Vibrio sp. SCSIO 43140]